MVPGHQIPTRNTGIIHLAAYIYFEGDVECWPKRNVDNNRIDTDQSRSQLSRIPTDDCFS